MALARTPRELLATVSRDDLCEMMAFERLEPFGALADEFRIGKVAATIANVHRGKDIDPFTPEMFMPALARAMEGYSPEPEAVELDPEAQSALMDAVLFGRAKG